MTSLQPPIAVFAYRRPRHLRAVLEALAGNAEAKDSLLYVFSDAPRDDGALEDVRQVRTLVENIRGFGEVKVVYREQNVGLSRNLVDGISQVLSRHDQVIVFEDDVVAGPHALRFFSDGLSLYREEPRVAGITAYCFPVMQPLPDTFFLRGAGNCWGWATWRDRWRHYNPDGTQLLGALKAAGLCRAFDLNGTVPFTDMLKDQIAGRNDSWAVRWHASCFVRGLLTLHPGESLTQNIGFDGMNSTHCRRTSRYDVQVHKEPVSLTRLAPAENAPAREAHIAFHRRTRPPLFATRKLLRGLRRKIAPLASAVSK